MNQGQKLSLLLLPLLFFFLSFPSSFQGKSRIFGGREQLSMLRQPLPVQHQVLLGTAHGAKISIVWKRGKQFLQEEEMSSWSHAVQGAEIKSS